MSIQFKTIIITALCLSASIFNAQAKKGVDPTLTKSELEDKIRGAWCGQTIGCTYGGPTEFKFGGFINDELDIPWGPHIVRDIYDKSPGLYDDIYMDLSFVEIFDKLGLDAPIDAFANAFANAPFPLWHANLKARYNILYTDLKPTECGYWENNPHSDDIDFQIEADYAGIMSPGMVNAASHYCDEIGHLMNYGDGWYGGVYVAAMYALAFVCDDVEYVAAEALKAIPEASRYYKCMADVIKWHKKYPNDWEITWALVNRSYGWDVGCPDGVFNSFNIDAVINSAYVLIGLLYGNMDFGKTIDIATRCGQDSDCNPATAGGILGTILGYKGIPEYWKQPLAEVMDRPFEFTSTSLNRAVELSMKQALEVIVRNGGKVKKNSIRIKVQTPQPVRFEQGFTDHYPYKYFDVRKSIEKSGVVSFEGTGCVAKGNVNKLKGFVDTGYVAEFDVYLDGAFSRKVSIPVSGNGVPAEFYQKYKLNPGSHTLEFRWLNRPEECKFDIVFRTVLAYTNYPAKTLHK